MKNTPIRAYLESKKDEITDILMRLARVPSVRSEAEPGAPFGRECRRALELTRDIYGEYGYSGKLSDSGTLTVTVGEGEKSIGIFAHADVVPAGVDWQVTEPFEPILKDGVLYGRGVRDNKSAIACSLFAAEALKALDIRLSSRLVLVTGSNEESGMADMPSFLAENEAPTVSLVSDAICAVIRGERGVLRFYATSREKLDSIAELSGGEALNVVLGRAKATLADSDEAFAELEKLCAHHDRLTLERADGAIVLTAEGIAAHASRPEGSMTAAKPLFSALLDCKHLSDSDRAILESARTLLGDYYGESFGISENDDCFGRTTIVNATVAIVDRRLKLGFDVRFVGKSPLEAVNAKLDSLGFDCETVRNSPGYLHDDSDPIMNCILDVYREQTENPDAMPVPSPGGTYARALSRAYTVGCRLYDKTPLKLPAGHGNAHQPDEFVNIDALLDQTAIIAETFIALDRKINEV